MSDTVQPFSRLRENGHGLRHPRLADTVDFEADNALLRIALAQSEGDGERRELVMQELKHRIGNLLAVVQAMARHTFRDGDPASLDSFTARLHALAAAQKLLIEGEDNAAMLATVVGNAVAPHCETGDRFSMHGPEVLLSGRHAHALTLAVHELGTNAAKYGALSVAAGRIEVTWTLTAGRLEFLWAEHGGPKVAIPTRRGFGSMLITRNLALAFAGVVDLEFNPAGVQCRLDALLTADG